MKGQSFVTNFLSPDLFDILSLVFHDYVAYFLQLVLNMKLDYTAENDRGNQK